jgi:uncharacterized protein YjiS (DUF1127 family)
MARRCAVNDHPWPPDEEVPMSSTVVAWPRRRSRGGFRRALAAAWARWMEARQRRETMRYLAQMDDHMLSDLGVSRAQLFFEMDRPAGCRE